MKTTDDPRGVEHSSRLKRTPLIGLAVAASTFMAAGGARADLSISQVPLYLSTSVKPNVMLEIDNSNSMATVIYPKNYDPNMDYPSWIEDWKFPRGIPILVGYGKMKRYDGDGCPSGTIRGHRDSKTKCIKFPHSLGDRTAYNHKYLNYLFNTYPDGTDLINNHPEVPKTTRIEVAKKVTKQLVNNNPGLRFGLTTFNPRTQSDPGPGGSIIANVGSGNSNVVNAVESLTPTSSTQLAETYYEITRYFRGLTPFMGHHSGTYLSPIQYRCQKNFVILITDGFPKDDFRQASIQMLDSLNDPDDPDHKLPDWDGKYDANNVFTTRYLDDLAKFGYDIDLHKGGTDQTGTSYDKAPFAHQDLQTYTVGFTVGDDMLKDAAAYGHGRYYTADNPSQLADALKSAVADISNRASSSSSVAAVSSQVRQGARIFQARFTASGWSGQLVSFPIDANASQGTQRLGKQDWDAADQLKPSLGQVLFRKILSYDPTANSGQGAGEIFLWDHINATQKKQLRTDINGTLNPIHTGKNRVNWLRGLNATDSIIQNDNFRKRPKTALGDIVHSDPIYVGTPPASGLQTLSPEGASYLTFYHNHDASHRQPVVYGGANDGMLHAFNASNGHEMFAYVPNAVFPKLSHLTSPDYDQHHEYFVDGDQVVQPAYFGGGWHTVLVGTLGAGGKGVYALDVTDPTFPGFDQPTSQRVKEVVLWDLTAKNLPQLGDTFSKPTIVRLHNKQWAAVFGNGYASDGGDAALYIVNIRTGKVIKKIDTHAGGDNGLSSPIAVDADGDHITDYIYAGDLKGNLWKFDVTSADRINWGVAYGTSANPAPLFVAKTPDGLSRQPITAKPDVGLNPKGGLIVYFGTGKYFETQDGSAGGSSQQQTFYAIYDTPGNNAGYIPPTRDDLHHQTVLNKSLTLPQNAQYTASELRVTSQEQLDEDDQGWLLDLPGSGERQVDHPMLRSGRIIFATKTPNTARCGLGGTSTLYELDALTGGRLDYSPFDVNDDLKFNQGDYVTVKVGGKKTQAAANVLKTSIGLASPPTIVSNGNGSEAKYLSGSSGKLKKIYENTGAAPRLSWRQLQ